MRKLDRSEYGAPPCLQRYQPGTHNWAGVTLEHKDEIRTHLHTMQGKRCAYCEGDLDELGQHIEHFRRKSMFPALIFDWCNLYCSCDQRDSCGHFKDHGAGPYNIADLIDPCLEDPDNFFVFRSDGTIILRRNLSETDEHRAKETLRVLSLDAQWGRLRKMRQAELAGYAKEAQEAVNAGFTPDEIREYFAELLNHARGRPFYTAIRHVLTGRQP